MHSRDWTRPGFRAVAVHRFGAWRMGVRSKLLRAPLSVLYRAMFRYVRNHYGIELPYSVQLGRGVVFEHQGAVVIHGNSRIGDGCIIRQGVTLGNRSLDRPHEAPVLGERVNVGAGAKILGDVTVGDGAVIGANAVVLTDVPPGALAVGVPAVVREARGFAAGERGGVRASERASEWAGGSAEVESDEPGRCRCHRAERGGSSAALPPVARRAGGGDGVR